MKPIATLVPPLHQSTGDIMACPHSYGGQFIEGERSADSPESWRGREVHDVMRKYVTYCTTRQVPADWKEFDAIAGAVSIEAGHICDGLRDSYLVRYKDVVAVEESIRLDENFQCVEFEAEAAYSGILDVILTAGEKAMDIDDYKSHPIPFEPNTLQSLMYPVLVMQKMPWLELVTFNLRFVRYANVVRSVTWKRADLPKMMAELARYRNRQISYHADYDRDGLDGLPAIPHAGCHYCPKLQLGTCPVAERNGQGQDSDDLVRELVFITARAEYVKGVLKNAVQARGGAIVVRDANGTEASFGPAPKESISYPATTVLPAIQRWCAATGDQAFLNSVNISSTSISSKLDTNKRRSLQREIELLTRKATKITTKLTTQNIGEAEPEEEW